ncbi:MAG: hypothetical protein LH471_09360 [Salinibacterium sp.]|nr:hypothetical protein [Salinibacterium sp.]
MTWSDYERVVQTMDIDADPPAGLIVHAAGETDGKWQSVDVWESQAAYERFREERLMPAVIKAMGEEAATAGPPPQETFDVKHIVKG